MSNLLGGLITVLEIGFWMFALILAAAASAAFFAWVLSIFLALTGRL